jgi:predicted nucleic acid-binding protein
LQKGKMGVAECIALALEKECDDLVGAIGGG